MGVEVVRRACHCCGGRPIISFRGLARDVDAALRASGSTGKGDVVPQLDAAGRYWCDDCWQRPEGRRERRLGKLRTLAENAQAPLPERESALRRIMEIEGASIPGAGMSEDLLRDVLRIEKDARREGDELRTRRFALERRQRVRRRAGLCSAVASLLFFTACRFELTGGFYFMVALSLLVISYWYQFRPDEERWTIGQAVAYAVWFSFLAWLVTPLQQIVVDYFVRFA